MKKFSYSNVDFILKVTISHSGYNYCRNDLPVDASKFDRILCKSWNAAHDSGYFRYRLDDHLPTKVLPGRHGFVAQLNEKRAVQRRKPQDIGSVSQPFDERLFNFTKVDYDKEVLFELEKSTLLSFTYNENGGEIEIADDLVNHRHLMVINVSPLEYGNSLLIPFVDSCLPQVLTMEGIEMGLELVLLSSTPSFRVGFNSLCANASVNHHHFHVFYLGHKLSLETLDVNRLTDDCYEINSCNYPAVGFAFQLIKSEDARRLAKFIFMLTKYFQTNDIPHNLFMTRGSRFNDGPLPFEASITTTEYYDAVRVFLWVRRPIYGVKDDLDFNVACCELAGHLPIKKRDSYDAITEADVCRELSDSCMDAFKSVRPNIISLIQNYK